MAILYTIVARGSIVLAEYSSTPSNANLVARQILEKLPNLADSRVSYSHGRFIFHVARTDGLTFLCMAKDTLGRRIPFAFLEDIHIRFVNAYGRTSYTALAYAMNDEFSRVLSQQMEYYLYDPNADTINRMKGEMNQIRHVMIENIDKILGRGDRLELLVDQTDGTQSRAIRLQKQARQFRSSMCWRNIKLVSGLTFLFVLVVYIALAVYCRGVTLPTCH